MGSLLCLTWDILYQVAERVITYAGLGFNPVISLCVTNCCNTHLKVDVQLMYNSTVFMTVAFCLHRII